MNISYLELGWLVGILEGEGTFHFDGRQEAVNLQMSDEDTVYRYAKLIEKITGFMPTIGFLDREPNRSVMYQCSIKGKRACAIMKLIVPHMGTRRRARIWQVLNKYKQKHSELKAANLIQLVKERA